MSRVRPSASAAVKRFGLALFLAAWLAPAADASQPMLIAALAIPGSVRPTSAAFIEERGLLLVGTTRGKGHDELYAVDLGADGVSPSIAWSLNLDASVLGISVDGSRAYLATSDDAAELVIVDLDGRRRSGAFDAPGPADAIEVALDQPGSVVLGRRRNRGAEFYRLDVSDPANVIVIEAIDDPRGARPRRLEELPRFHHRGRLVGYAAKKTARGTLHYLVVSDPHLQVQVAEQTVPAAFADVDGDGVYRLGCLGDSNTIAFPNQPAWCEILRGEIDDPDFAIVNVAVAGATAVTPNLRFDSDAAMQMNEIVGQHLDAVVLAFGTNDAFDGRTGVQIRDAYLAQQATADALGIGFFVATTPPIHDCTGPACPSILEGNALLRSAFAGRVLEFFDGFTDDDFSPDGVHVNAAGQALRASRGLAVLANPFVYGAP